jgi:hypothetical protein
MRFLRAFLYFFLIFCVVEAGYWLLFGKLPSKNIDTYVVGPIALILAFALAHVFNYYRSRPNGE